MSWIVGFAVLFSIASIIGQRLALSKRLRAIEQQVDKAKREPDPHGRRILVDNVFVGTRGSGRSEVDLFRHRLTIDSMFPKWVAFGWSNPRPKVFDRNLLWMQVLQAGPLVAGLPGGSTLFARDGDLVYESEAAPNPIPHSAVIDFSRTCGRTEDVLVEGLLAVAIGGQLPLRPVALRILVRSVPNDPRTAVALKQAGSSSDDELRAIALVMNPNEGPDKLRGIARDASASKGARSEAIRGLIARRDDRGLLSITAHPVPEDTQLAFLQQLRRIKDERTEPIVRGYLVTDARAAAIDLLAVIGTRESVSALRGLMEHRELTDDERVGIDVAIELIHDRIQGRVGSALGAMSVVDEGEEGHLSMSSKEAGSLSLDEDER